MEKLHIVVCNIVLSFFPYVNNLVCIFSLFFVLFYDFLYFYFLFNMFSFWLMPFSLIIFPTSSVSQTKTHTVLILLHNLLPDSKNTRLQITYKPTVQWNTDFFSFHFTLLCNSSERHFKYFFLHFSLLKIRLLITWFLHSFITFIQFCLPLVSSLLSLLLFLSVFFMLAKVFFFFCKTSHLKPHLMIASRPNTYLTLHNK